MDLGCQKESLLRKISLKQANICRKPSMRHWLVFRLLVPWGGFTMLIKENH